MKPIVANCCGSRSMKRAPTTAQCVLDHLVEMGLVLSYDEYRGVVIKPAHKTGKSSAQNT